MSTLIKNPFSRKASDYSRDIDVINGAIDQSVILLSRAYGHPPEDVREFVINELKQGKRKFQDPAVLFLQQEENEDRCLKKARLSKYLKSAQKEGLLMAPTLTQILPPNRKKSLLSEYITGNLAKRNEEKKLQLEHASKGNRFKETLHKNNQNNKKILNNAISGNHRSIHSILYDRPVHPVLTASCRVANGTANANNERLLSGSRYYATPDIVLSNIVSIIELTDFDAVKLAVDIHGMHIPSVEETLSVLSRSTDLYWKGIDNHRYINQLINVLTPYERCAVCYTGDLYHIAKFNYAIVKDILDALTKIPTEITPDHIDWLNHVDEDTLSQIKVRFPEIVGREHFWHEKVQQHPDFPLLGSMGKQIYTTLDKYKEVISCFLLSKNIPLLISDFPTAIRRVGVGSDTDSAIFTVQDWAILYNGNDNVSYDNILLAEAMAFLVSQVTTHVLAAQTVNMGVTNEKEVFRLSMKNEFLFPVFMLASRAKHYAALQKVQEGVIFDVAKLEKKGANFIASNAPTDVREDLNKTIMEILTKQEKGERVSLHDLIIRVADWEHRIFNSISSGETTFLKSARVKEEDGYTQEAHLSRHRNYVLWEKVFADTHGHCQMVPYSALAFSIIPNTKAKTDKWISSWKNRERANRFRALLNEMGKTYLGEILLPEENILSMGIPEEILPVIDIRKIVAAAVAPFYLLLESLEFYLNDSHQCKLIMDTISQDDILRYRQRHCK